MISNETITTKNYRLRGMKITDASELYPIFCDMDTMKYITPHPIESVSEMENLIKKNISNLQEEKEIPWVIEDKDIGMIVGTFRFHKLNLWHKKAEMGVVIRKEYQRKGVMTEVLKRMIPYAFSELCLNRLVGDIFAGNIGSQKLLERFGFEKEGVLRETDFDGEYYHDTVVYSLLRKEFEQKKEIYE
ncbi:MULTISPECIES: GNAT family N-acetyltransferase [Bacillaceae]|uniref:GNAT family N-acetyltransferase n=1 Tax=Evansella alkalicola TaxID=745819 RepID=A0ABS6JV76_9BACI|nr:MULTISPECIES: GNAT family N-acetyltransferase [Bacillaceae]MBU9722388.1 GNAT family N-acetyltransferase [Bacillus alkalicola]